MHAGGDNNKLYYYIREQTNKTNTVKNIHYIIGARLVFLIQMAGGGQTGQCVYRMRYDERMWCMCLDIYT